MTEQLRAAAQQALSELSSIYEWAQIEKSPLRQQEIKSIFRVVGILRCALAQPVEPVVAQPVAWANERQLQLMATGDRDWIMVWGQSGCTAGDPHDVPTSLYRTPPPLKQVERLTDEEILEISASLCMDDKPATSKRLARAIEQHIHAKLKGAQP